MAKPTKADLQELLGETQKKNNVSTRSKPDPHSLSGLQPNTTVSSAANLSSSDLEDKNDNAVTSSDTTSSESSPKYSKAPADIAAEESQGETYANLDKAKELLKSSFIYESSMEMLGHYSEEVREGRVTLHKWQVEESEKICKTEATDLKPFKYCLCAANGSGKDSFLIAPFAVWFILCKIKARVVITSSSGTQLTAQTETYIKNLCYAINTYWEEMGYPKVFKVNQRYIKCLYTNSEIRMYATDEPGKAEGYHPIEPYAPFAIIVNEAKSIREEIFAAIKRCTGFSHYLMISSPGEAKGSFHWAFNNWPNVKRIDAFDCTHIPLSEIESDKLELGEDSALYRSMRLALFTSLGGSVVITSDAVDKCKKLCTRKTHQHWPIRVGIDLAAGGDECVISAWKGNARINQWTWREKDTTVTADLIEFYLAQELKLSKTHPYIRADDGGVGRGIIDMLARRGWRLTRVINQSAAQNKSMYGNRGAELWYRFKRLIEECFILLPTDDEKFMSQIGSRHYAQSSGGSNRIFLQEKKEAKSQGFPSPDRADAAIIANLDVTVESFLLDKEGTDNATDLSQNRRILTLEEAIKEQENKKFAYFEREQTNLNQLLSSPRSYVAGDLLSGIPSVDDPMTTYRKLSDKLINNSLDCCL